MMKITVNADDYGWSQSCSKAIISAYEQHLIQTTTMISNGSYFEDAATLLEKSTLKEYVGIHFDLTEGCPLTEGIKSDSFFCGSDGLFHMHMNRYSSLNREQKKHAYDELCAQVRRFHSAGFHIHHADSHHHIHTAPNIYPIVVCVMKEFGIEKMRISRNIGGMSFVKKLLKTGFNVSLKIQKLNYTDYFCGLSEFSRIHFDQKDTIVELMCHPDFDSKGIIIDRFDVSSYEEPTGEDLSALLEGVNERGISLVSW